MANASLKKRAFKIDGAILTILNSPEISMKYPNVGESTAEGIA